MKTEAKIKSQVTPEVIKKMVELAEGFEYGLFDNISLNKFHVHSEFLFSVENIIFLSTLIHRAVEGWNKSQVNSENCIVIQDDSVILWSENLVDCKTFDFPDYQPSTLTACECALLDCLCEVLK